MALLAALAPPARAVEPPTIVLYPRTLGNADDVSALVSVRRKLRDDGQFGVLTFDPESLAVRRAAAENKHPEWLTTPPTTDADRLAVTRALGAAFFVVVAPSGGRDKATVHLAETAPGARTWDVADKKIGDAAKAIEQQAQDALAHPIAVASTPTVPVPAPVRPTAPPPAPPAAVAALPKPTPPPVVSAPAPISPPTVQPTPASAPPAPAVASPTPQAAPPVTTQAPAVVASKPPAVSTPAPVAVSPPAVPVPSKEAVTPMPPMTVPAPAPVTPPVVPAPAPVTPPVVPAPAPVTPPPSVPALASAGPTVVVTLNADGSGVATMPSASPIPGQTAKALPRGSDGKGISAAEDISAVGSLLARGDEAMTRTNVVEAISFYRQAVNGAPLSVVPRLRLAKAYLQAGLHDKALDEAKRALEVSPNSVPVQDFLIQMDTEAGTSEGAVTRYQAVVARSPQDAAAHLALGDSFWNSGQLSDAEGEYQTALRLAPAGHEAPARLARLYAALTRYDDSLKMLNSAGDDGYTLALGIVQNRADTLSSTIDAARQDFDKGTSTREKFYDVMKTVSAQSQTLADFVAKVTPPVACKLSHLHRALATNLLAQEAAVLVTFVETADPKQAAKADQLEKDAQTEMLTAHAAEEKLGLWAAKGGA